MIALPMVRKPQHMPFALQNVVNQRFVVLAFLVVFFIFSWSVHFSDRRPFGARRLSQYPPEIQAIYNETLGVRSSSSSPPSLSTDLMLEY